MAGAKRKAAKTAAKKKTAPAKKKTAPAKKKAPARKKVAPAKKKVAPAKKKNKKKAPAKKATLGVTRRRVASRPVDDEAPTVEISSAPHSERLAPTREIEAVSSTSIPPARPSERVLAAVSETPEERVLTKEEEEAMAKVAETARKVIEAEGGPSAIVGAIASFLEDVRVGRREEPKSQDVRLGLGVLWGEQLRAQVRWTWVHLTYPDGFASYALVPDDRAFACFPLNRVPEALRGTGTNTSAHVFESIREGALPTRKERAYLVIG